ncbi:helix-turn-helix domain-containing protein [Streptomyces luteolus]|uniref:MerR family transcriptional regulator n=1 Tax=Streptomyces luteolus TaxID=3043615 RepID=A0ABT6SZ59_9ACTN|nr:MerR family transcriptional regulator [Streptomyces sp. B-S-A12]MDI3420881.1 MerR family transcriptional regulator [Streptomyces sp. B-S-A12]
MKSSEHGPPLSVDREPVSIGAIAQHFGLATHVLRHWESMGLLTPVRDAAGRRRYGITDRTRVAVTMRAKEAGLSLNTIRSLATASDPVRRRQILGEEAELLRSRITAAQASLDLIECALDCDHEDFTQCADFQQLVAGRIGIAPGSRTTA